MRSVNIAKLKNQRSKYLNFARAGEEVGIRNRNLPVAKLVPFLAEEAGDEEMLLVAAGKMRLPVTPLNVKELLRMPTARLTQGEATQALLKDREEGPPIGG